MGGRRLKPAGERIGERACRGFLALAGFVFGVSAAGQPLGNDRYPSDAWATDYLEIPFGDARAMILNFGPADTTAYVYWQADDAKFEEVTLSYTHAGKPEVLRDSSYPFEFILPLSRDATEFRFQLQGRTVDGRRTGAESHMLAR